MLKQKLEQKLLQKLSPQQIQLMKLLQVPAMALEDRIKQEIESNPALEEGGDDEDEIENMSVEDDYDVDNEEEDINIDGSDKKEKTEDYDTAERDESEFETKKNKETDDNEFSFSDYVDDDEYIPAYKLNADNDQDEQRKDIPYSDNISFQDFLISQLGIQVLDDRQYQIGLNLIGNIDESGYMNRSTDAIVNDLAFSQNIMTTKDEVQEILEIIQQFDPPGVGAKNLQECLLIQLKRIEEPSKAITNAILIIGKHFDDYTKRHYDKIMLKINISDEEMKEANAEILKLDPKPGNAPEEFIKTNQYIIPDFLISNNNEELILTLNSRNAPDLRMSKSYLGMLDSYGQNEKGKSSKNKEALTFVRQKLDSAKWFIDALKQRETTLFQTMNAIMNYQKEYFLTGDEAKLKPMILKDIADRVNLDISTISRVSNSKYVQTPYGIFLLKTFFSEGMQMDSGEEVSSREVKKILKDFIDSEDKKNPLKDDILSKMLKEKGYSIARRTIAKYREQLDIPVARLRKEI